MNVMDAAIVNPEVKFKRKLLDKLLSSVPFLCDEYIIFAGDNAFQFIMSQAEAITCKDREGNERYFFNHTEVINNHIAVPDVVWVAKKCEFPMFFRLEEA